jgi:hypothetical protein
MLFGRRRFDPQPTAPAAVLLATTGEAFSKAAIRRAHELAAGEPVAVLTILKVYGSQFGLPNPGFALMQRTIAALERRGSTVDGQIATTRSAGQTIAKVARARNVRYVVMDDREQTGVGRFAQASVLATVRRRLATGTVLELVAVPASR